MSWDSVAPTGNFLDINYPSSIEIVNIDVKSEQEKLNQNAEDKSIIWNQDMKSADLAYILYQVPVMIAIHASEMLPKQ